MARPKSKAVIVPTPAGPKRPKSTGTPAPAACKPSRMPSVQAKLKAAAVLAQAAVVVTPASVPVQSPGSVPGSKQAGIIAGLRRPEGMTMAELMRLTGWMSHSVRGALSGALKRKLGLLIASSIETDRGRVYRIVDPVPTPVPTKRRRSKQQAGGTGAAA